MGRRRLPGGTRAVGRGGARRRVRPAGSANATWRGEGGWGVGRGVGDGERGEGATRRTSGSAGGDRGRARDQKGHRRTSCVGRLGRGYDSPRAGGRPSTCHRPGGRPRPTSSADRELDEPRARIDCAARSHACPLFIRRFPRRAPPRAGRRPRGAFFRASTSIHRRVALVVVTSCRPSLQPFTAPRPGAPSLLLLLPATMEGDPETSTTARELWRGAVAKLAAARTHVDDGARDGDAFARVVKQKTFVTMVNGERAFRAAFGARSLRTGLSLSDDRSTPSREAVASAPPQPSSARSPSSVVPDAAAVDDGDDDVGKFFKRGGHWTPQSAARFAVVEASAEEGGSGPRTPLGSTWPTPEVQPLQFFRSFQYEALLAPRRSGSR